MGVPGVSARGVCVITRKSARQRLKPADLSVVRARLKTRLSKRDVFEEGGETRGSKRDPSLRSLRVAQGEQDDVFLGWRHRVEEGRPRWDLGDSGLKILMHGWGALKLTRVIVDGQA